MNQHMRLLLPLLLLLPIAHADLIHVTPKQLDEALPIVEHALVHVYDDEPHAAVENITTFSSIPIYALEETHDRFPKNISSIYLSVRNITIPFSERPKLFPVLLEHIASLYPKIYVQNVNVDLTNGNRSIDAEVLDFCFRIPEFQCVSTDIDSHMVFMNSTWDPVEDIQSFFRRNIFPLPLVDESADTQGNFLMLLRIYHEHVFLVNQYDAMARTIRPVIEDTNYTIGFSMFSDLAPFEKQYDATNISAIYMSTLTGFNKTYTGPITEDSLRTFLTTCTETI